MEKMSENKIERLAHIGVGAERLDLFSQWLFSNFTCYTV
jgi:hypothetical protein